MASEGNIPHRGTDETHISCAKYAKPGSAVPERCSEHRRDGDVLIVDVCGHDGCTNGVKFTRSADATCGGAHGYCPEHGKDRNGYHRRESERCYGGDGKCKDYACHHRVEGADGAGAARLCPGHFAGLGGAARKQYARPDSHRCYGGDGTCLKPAAHHRVAGAVGAGAARLCPEHFAGLGGAARKQYARWESYRCYGGDGDCSKPAAHRRVAGADGAGAAALCPEHFAGLGGAARKQYARRSNGCDNCSSGYQGYVRRDNPDYGLCPACHDALDAATQQKWWRKPSARCGDGRCGAVACCPRLADAPLNLPERLCEAHVKDLPPAEQKFYKPPPKSGKKMCDRCGDRQAVFFDDDGLGKMRCATHALEGPRLKKRKRESCVGLKRVQSKRCGDGTCHTDGSQGVQRIGNSTSRLCVGCGTVGKPGNKRPIEGYEFVSEKKRGGGR